MSATLATVEKNIRVGLLGGTKQSMNVCGSRRMLRLIGVAVVDVAGRLDIGIEWVTSIATLAEGDHDYDLANTQEYRRILAVRRAWDKELLEPVTPEVMAAHRQGDVDDQGEPARYALLEKSPATAGVATVTLLVDPEPSSTETGKLLDALVSYEPVAPDESTDVIPLTDRARMAVEHMVAVTVLAGATDEQLQEMRLDRQAAARYDGIAGSLMESEQTRVWSQRRPSGIALVEG